ncbi:MAG: ATP-grasp domain-containing protein [Bacillota bacterium]|nr:ATP-grasp domain-containing protein [Bacillota bacterium]
MNRALITDVHYRMGLAAVRSLGRRSIPVTAVEFNNIPQKSVLGFYSRYTDDKKIVPNALENQMEFVNSIIKIAEEQQNTAANHMDKPVLIPVGLDSLMAVSRYDKLLEPYYDFVVPPLESIEIANDTEKLLEVAEKIGVPYPESTTLAENETVEHLSQRIGYPVVIKYRKGELLKLSAGKRYRIIHDQKTFIEAFKEMHAIQKYPLVQRYVSGTGFGVSVVFDRRGEPLEIFCHKRLREYPATGGPSCFCESVWDDRLVDYAVKLLKALNWRGVAMVEFKGDLDYEVCLMEINPRFWGSLPLSIASGCDIPYAIYRAASWEFSKENDATGYKWSPERYKKGKRMRYLLQDIMTLPGYLKITKNKAGFLAKFTAQLFNPTISEGVFEFKDWKPSLAYLRQAVKKI